MPDSRKFIGLRLALQSVIHASGGADAERKAKTGGDRIMYIECKGGGLQGEARIGRVTFSKTGRTLYYQGLSFQSLKGAGFKSNYCCLETGDDYWISGPKRRGGDALYGGGSPVSIDADARDEYWRDIRGLPELAERGTT